MAGTGGNGATRAQGGPSHAAAGNMRTRDINKPEWRAPLALHRPAQPAHVIMGPTIAAQASTNRVSWSQPIMGARGPGSGKSVP